MNESNDQNPSLQKMSNEEFVDEISKLLDEHFPKGSFPEKGEAILMAAKLNLNPGERKAIG